MSSLADEIAAQVRKGGSPCMFCKAVASLDKADRDALAAALEDGSVQGTAIERALNNRGLRVPRHSAAKHRREGCRDWPVK